MKKAFTLLLFLGVFWGMQPFVLSQESSQYSKIEVKNGGKLSGRVTLKGEVPALQKLKITKDQKICGKDPKYDESIVVSKENHGLKNAVVSIVNISKGKSWPAGANPPVFSQNGCRFDPHVLVVPVAAKISILNNDGILHNVHTHSEDNGPLNRAQPKFLKKMSVSFEQPEFIRVACDVHNWMNGWLVVAAHPYYAVTDESGNFTITDIPAGSYRIQIWHEKLGEQTKEVSITEGGAAKLDALFERK